MKALVLIYHSDRCVRAWGLVRWASYAGVWRFADLWQPVGRHSRSGPFCDNSCKLVLEQGIIHVGVEFCYHRRSRICLDCFQVWLACQEVFKSFCSVTWRWHGGPVLLWWSWLRACLCVVQPQRKWLDSPQKPV